MVRTRIIEYNRPFLLTADGLWRRMQVNWEIDCEPGLSEYAVEAWERQQGGGVKVVFERGEEDADTRMWG